ncbi:MAG TPA: GH116 family glycosyl-hydrolase [Candidatus Acidoferrales bacterium]|nr:GH116 family glycosyl-hydrolase [Candidatus Acidoferrales bacterium]
MGYRVCASSIAIIVSSLLIFPSLLDARVNQRNIWPVPACAWSRSLGNHPNGATTWNKRGVPLGGFGAGNFMYNYCGTFGPWEFQTGNHEEKFLSQAAFHVFEQVSGVPDVVKTLATEDVLPAWNRLPQDSGTYYALYPKAWFVYSGTTADVSLKQFTPIIPNNYRETSYPVSVFQFQLSNPTSDTLKIAVMFTFPNAPYGSDTRTGLVNQAVQQDDITGVVMKASSSENPATTQNTEWCIATQAVSGATVSFCTSWNGNGNGQDIYDRFGANGVLPDSAIDTSSTASAIAVEISLAPGSTAVVPFVLSWDFPRVRFGWGTEWYRRYTEYFGFTGDHSFDIAKEALMSSEEWESEIDRWQNLIINEPLYPDWLKQGALNELYFDTFGGVFWENGCITKPAESSYGTLPADDHKYFCTECPDYLFLESFDVRQYGARHYLELWPDIDRDVLKWNADYVANDPTGDVPHDAGRAGEDPFFHYSVACGCQGWQDMPNRFIQQVYAYYQKTRDESFLDFVWPACLKAYNRAKSFDTNHNGIPDNGNTTYDTFPFTGDNLFTGGLFVAATEAMERMALAKNDTAFSRELHQDYLSLKSTLDTLFWKPDQQYYKIDAGSAGIMADGLNGQRYCETTGLDPILPPDRIASHLNKVYEMCVAPLRDYDGDGEGDEGMVNGRNSDGSPITYGQQPAEVWSGTTYFVAAMMYHWGRLTNDARLEERALKAAHGAYFQTWVNDSTAYFFDTPEAWYADNPRQFRAQQYQRPRAIWELLLEIKDPFDTLTSIHPPAFDHAPAKFALYQNYPNPFNPGTAISFSIPSRSFVNLKIYDVLGREVTSVVSEELSAGNYTRQLNCSSWPSGVYFCRLQSANFISTKKLLLLK